MKDSKENAEWGMISNRNSKTQMQR